MIIIRLCESLNYYSLIYVYLFYELGVLYKVTSIDRCDKELFYSRGIYIYISQFGTLIRLFRLFMHQGLVLGLSFNLSDRFNSFI